MLEDVHVVSPVYSFLLSIRIGMTVFYDVMDMEFPMRAPPWRS
jgi:hypothetical protein